MWYLPLTKQQLKHKDNALGWQSANLHQACNQTNTNRLLGLAPFTDRVIVHARTMTRERARGG